MTTPPPADGPSREEHEVVVLGRRPRGRRRVIGVLLVLLALVAAVTALLVRRPSDTQGPEVTAIAFFSAQDRHNYAAEWAFMTPRRKAIWGSQGAFAAYLDKLYHDIQGHCCHFSTFAVHEVRIDGDRATVVVDETRRTDGTDSPDDAYLRRIGDRWLVDSFGDQLPSGWPTP